MGVDFGLMLLFAIAGLALLIGLLPLDINITGSDWYMSAHQFWLKYVLSYGMQFSSWLPIKAIAEVANIFLTFIIAMFTFNIARLIINIVTGGGSRA